MSMHSHGHPRPQPDAGSEPPGMQSIYLPARISKNAELHLPSALIPNSGARRGRWYWVWGM
eukprot:213604-Chlamydomonas_euryale.AAC.29